MFPNPQTTHIDLLVPRRLSVTAGRLDGDRGGRAARRLLQTQSPVHSVGTRGADPGTGDGAGKDPVQEFGQR